jgi:2-polyprenyl-3-methyl-5-hydroxy-6-metoxy-1,4-benzoquinol methylase
MRQQHFQDYYSESFQLVTANNDSSIETGEIVRKSEPEKVIPILNGVPRFVEKENYADNFGLQWNIFRSTQLDSVSGHPISENRLWSSCNWNPESLRGARVLEVGSGAGRFTEVLARTGASVVSCDYSSAVDANYKNNGHQSNVHILQADLYDLPFDDESFDFVLCYGVLQHTPDPEDAFKKIFKKCKKGGKVSIDFYRRFRIPTAWTTPKYLWRPITRRLPPEKLLRIVQSYVPWYLPFDTLVRKLGPLGTVLLGLLPIPCWNHVNLGLSKTQRKEWAIMDTFDALGAKYDRPFLKTEVENLANTINAANSNVFYGGQGVICNLTR